MQAVSVVKLQASCRLRKCYLLSHLWFFLESVSSHHWAEKEYHSHVMGSGTDLDWLGLHAQQVSRAIMVLQTKTED